MSAWNSMHIEFEVREARLVVVLKDGGAIVEENVSVLFDEGRYPTYTGQGEGKPVIADLSYHASFSPIGSDPGASSEAFEARIILDGIHSNGKRIEIRGNGWFGYDENSVFEATFTDPPLMLIDEEEDDDDEKKGGDESAQADPEFAHRALMIEPKPSDQYLKAAWGIPLERVEY